MPVKRRTSDPCPQRSLRVSRLRQVHGMEPAPYSEGEPISNEGTRSRVGSWGILQFGEQRKDGKGKGVRVAILEEYENSISSLRHGECARVSVGQCGATTTSCVGATHSRRIALVRRIRDELRRDDASITTIRVKPTATRRDVEQGRASVPCRKV